MKFQPLLAIPFFIAIICFQACGPVDFPPVVPEDKEVRASHQIKSPQVSGRIAILSHSTLNVKYLDIALDNHHRYATKFGYDYIFRNNLITERFFDKQSRSPLFQLGLYWQKIQATKDALDEGYEWVLWVDPDILFTNFDMRIEDIIANYRLNHEEFLVAHENFCFANTGVFLIHQSQWSHQMLEHIASLHSEYKDTLLPEQLAVQDYVLGFIFLGNDGRWQITPEEERNYYKKPIKNTAILPQRAMNSFYKGNFWLPGSTSEGSVWQPGYFLAHFAVRGSKKDSEMRALSACFKKQCGDNYENNSSCLKICQ
jgi:hypothetical protein